MRKRSIWAIAIAAGAATVAMVALAGAATFKVKSGNLEVTLGGTVSPSKLPRAQMAPVTTDIVGKIEGAGGLHPPALREVVVDIDKDAGIDSTGLPICKAGELEAQNTANARKACDGAVVGSGLAHAEIEFPEQPPIVVASPITVFNGGTGGGKTKLLIHTFITVPVPAAIVTQVTVAKKGAGLHSIARIPVIAGGAGSAIDFKFKLGRTYAYKGKQRSLLTARCPDGKFKVTAPKILFKNEARTDGFPGQLVLKGSVLVPCTPKG
jgi:hypothetical protein